MKEITRIKDISKNSPEQLLQIREEELMTLPCSVEGSIKTLTDEQRSQIECNLDGVTALRLPKPQNKDEEAQLVRKFLSGLKKLLNEDDNWTLLQPLKISLDYCAKCQMCNEACPIYVGSGRQEIYRPTFRSEVLRRIVNRYKKKSNSFLDWFTGNDVDLNWSTISRLAESAYRCTLCRRCAQTCSRGIDNGLISRELRKLFSQELNIAAKECHELGSVKQLKVGASTGLSPEAMEGIIEFIEEEIEEKTGKKIRIPVDKKDADILLIHNTGEFMSWPENPAAFAILFDAAGINWTLASEIGGYEATNYGLWYDDVQFARVALNHAQIAKKLRAKRIVIGECGHAHKAAIVIADRLYSGDLNIPRESCMPILEEIFMSGKIKFDPMRNNFPVTLHDPCNMVRAMGIVEPQRRIIRAICPQFREMTPHGVNNYCCGGGSGFAIMNSLNFPQWRSSVSGRMKMKQIIDAFQDVPDPSIQKYVCAPCSNCKGQIRDMFSFYNIGEQYNINYTGLVEFMVNAMADMPMPYIEVEEVPVVEAVSKGEKEALV